jgi:hypothetical protein
LVDLDPAMQRLLLDVNEALVKIACRARDQASGEDTRPDAAEQIPPTDARAA